MFLEQESYNKKTISVSLIDYMMQVAIKIRHVSVSEASIRLKEPIYLLIQRHTREVGHQRLVIHAHIVCLVLKIVHSWVLGSQLTRLEQQFVQESAHFWLAIKISCKSQCICMNVVFFVEKFYFSFIANDSNIIQLQALT